MHPIKTAVKHRLSVLAALRRTTISEIVVEAVARTLAEDEVQTLQDEKLSVAGALSQYADVEKRKQEDGAWLRHATVAEADRGQSK